MEIIDTRMFDGDIIITDPYFFVRKDCPEDWEICKIDENIKDLGFDNYMSSFTYWGDWNCIIMNTDNNKEIGCFMAKNSKVGVFMLEDVRDYNYDFINSNINLTYYSTIIKDFKGQIDFVIDTEYYDSYEIKHLTIVGHGINNKTGESINFKSKQVDEGFTNGEFLTK